MQRSLRIAIADDEAATRDFLNELLSRLGHQVSAAQSGRQLVEQCRQFKPELILTDIRMADMAGIEAALAINREMETPIILISGHQTPELLSGANGEAIMAYLVKPLKPADVEMAIAVAMMRFEQYQAVRKEARELRQALEDRKLIERAKGVVMRRLCVDEQEAFQRMKRFASNHNRKLVDVSAAVLTAEEIFHNLDAL